jgi:hypothetical protein
MDQRREARFRADELVKLTVLGDCESPVQARVKNVSGRGLGLEVASAIPPGAALKIEVGDAIILAEAVFCRRDDSSYFVGVALEQVLSGLAGLGRILQQFADEPSGAQQQYAMDDRRKQNRQQPQE